MMRGALGGPLFSQGRGALPEAKRPRRSFPTHNMAEATALKRIHTAFTCLVSTIP